MKNVWREEGRAIRSLSADTAAATADVFRRKVAVREEKNANREHLHCSLSFPRSGVIFTGEIHVLKLPGAIGRSGSSLRCVSGCDVLCAVWIVYISIVTYT